MNGNNGAASSVRVSPNLMAASGLAVKDETSSTQFANDLSCRESR